MTDKYKPVTTTMNSSRSDFVSNGTDSSGTCLDYEGIPLLLIDFFLATTAAVGNSMLLLTVYKDPHRSLRSPSTKLVVNMALADFMAGSLSGYLITAHDAIKFINKPMQLPRFGSHFVEDICQYRHSQCYSELLHCDCNGL